MIFTHDRLKPIELIRVDGLNGRKYVTPEGNSYPSVTTVLGFEPKPEIEAWRLKVGIEEAERVTRRACARGTVIHGYAEDYLNNLVPNISMFDVDVWRSLKPILDRINNIRLLEGKLYSDKLEIAGTCDAVGDYLKLLSLIDFKSSLRKKSEDEILGYFLQATCYACMVYERYNLKIKQLVIIVAVDNDDSQVFVKNVGDYLDKLFTMIDKYKAHKGIP